jgi:hypothetical protein
MKKEKKSFLDIFKKKKWLFINSYYYFN